MYMCSVYQYTYVYISKTLTRHRRILFFAIWVLWGDATWLNKITLLGHVGCKARSRWATFKLEFKRAAAGGNRGIK